MKKLMLLGLLLLPLLSQAALTCDATVQAVVGNTATVQIHCTDTSIPTPTTSGTVTLGDPGKGTWYYKGVKVVDQGGPGNITLFPNCVNGVVPSPSCITSNMVVPVGETTAIRYKTKDSVKATDYFKLASNQGSGLPYDISMSLSEVPGDFTCSKEGKKVSMPFILLGDCAVKPNTQYYLNIKATSACSGNCGLKIIEPIYSVQ